MFFCSSTSTENGEDVFPLYKLSYLWYSSIGCISCIIIGLIVSAITGFQDPEKLNPMTINPIVYRIKRLCKPTTSEENVCIFLKYYIDLKTCCFAMLHMRFKTHKV